MFHQPDTTLQRVLIVNNCAEAVPPIVVGRSYPILLRRFATPYIATSSPDWDQIRPICRMCHDWTLQYRESAITIYLPFGLAHLR